VKGVQEFLVPYLESKGIDTSINFTCLNSKHDDKSPSCGLLPDKTRTYCYSCGARYDIFDIAHILEDKPLNGFGFIVDTVKYLADKLEYEGNEYLIISEKDIIIII
jgi:hypothetical protein